MVMNQFAPETVQHLCDLLTAMADSADTLKAIGAKELEAIHAFDADLIAQLSGQRIALHERLAGLESQCKTLLIRAGVPDDMSLKQAIAACAGAETESLQTLREQVHAQIEDVEENTQEIRLRLLAAHNVNSSILQQLGLTGSSESTYDRGSIK